MDRNAAPRDAAKPQPAAAAAGPAADQGLRKLLIEQLKDMYFAEQQLVTALQQMRDSARHGKLKQAFAAHLLETQRQVERLAGAFGLLGQPPQEDRCNAISGILDETRELMQMQLSPAAHDAALVCAAQKIEHYEIGTYGTLLAYAEILKLDELAELIGENLNEERAADVRFTELAESDLNPRAALA